MARKMQTWSDGKPSSHKHRLWVYLMAESKDWSHPFCDNGFPNLGDLSIMFLGKY